MPNYVDVYFQPLAEAKPCPYEKLAAAVERIFGALRYREYVGSDVNTEDVVQFQKRIKLKPGKSDAHTNKVLKTIMADPEMKVMKDEKPPFDCRRMLYGGFKVLVDF